MATVDKLPMLAEGYEKLQNDVRHLKTVERPSIIDAIEEARGHGDLAENAEYHAAKERQGQVEAQIADIEDRLSRAMVIDPTTLSGDKAVFGATVHLLDENDQKVKYQIVGQTEADARSGRISYSSPLSPARVGRIPDDDRFVPVLLTPLTATLVHAGLIHLAFNLLIGLYCGRAVETILGGWSLLILYLLGAYAAAAAHWAVG